jgi:hypothetical protein
MTGGKHNDLWRDFPRTVPVGSVLFWMRSQALHNTLRCDPRELSTAGGEK